MVWPGVSHFVQFGDSALFGGCLGIVWRSSWTGTLVAFGVGLTQVQGRIIANVLNKKFVTLLAMGMERHRRLLRVSVCGGRWDGRGLFLLGGGGVPGVVFHVEL